MRLHFASVLFLVIQLRLCFGGDLVENSLRDARSNLHSTHRSQQSGTLKLSRLIPFEKSILGLSSSLEPSTHGSTPIAHQNHWTFATQNTDVGQPSAHSTAIISLLPSSQKTATTHQSKATARSQNHGRTLRSTTSHVSASSQRSQSSSPYLPESQSGHDGESSTSNKVSETAGTTYTSLHSQEETIQPGPRQQTITIDALAALCGFLGLMLALSLYLFYRRRRVKQRNLPARDKELWPWQFDKGADSRASERRPGFVSQNDPPRLPIIEAQPGLLPLKSQDPSQSPLLPATSPWTELWEQAARSSESLHSTPSASSTRSDLLESVVALYDRPLRRKIPREDLNSQFNVGSERHGQTLDEHDSSQNTTAPPIRPIIASNQPFRSSNQHHKAPSGIAQTAPDVTAHERTTSQRNSHPTQLQSKATETQQLQRPRPIIPSRERYQPSAGAKPAKSNQGPSRWDNKDSSNLPSSRRRFRPFFQPRSTSNSRQTLLPTISETEGFDFGFSEEWRAEKQRRLKTQAGSLSTEEQRESLLHPALRDRRDLGDFATYGPR